ncbi:TPA: hypothetical protein EYO57_00005 [Candidatus Poribacteria bacterium]|nr:hypothetical protein [Candidatus Poribacteria bacterium]
MSILQRLEQIKLDMPKLFNTRGKRRQLLQDEMIQWIDSIKRMYINEIDHLDGQIEYKQETINRLSAEIDWGKYLERSKEDISESQAVYAEKQRKARQNGGSNTPDL